MACRIRGQIVKYNNVLNADSNDVCRKHPCVALVKILEVGECGPAVTNPVQQSDTISIKFIYSLTDTRKLFPGMKVHYPGMKKGDIFHADVEMRLRPGTNGEYLVYGYTVEK